MLLAEPPLTHLGELACCRAGPLAHPGPGRLPAPLPREGALGQALDAAVPKAPPMCCDHATLQRHRCIRVPSQLHRQPTGLFVSQSTRPFVLHTEALRHGALRELCHFVSPVGVCSAGHTHPEHHDRHSLPGNAFYQRLPGEGLTRGETMNTWIISQAVFH